MDIKFLKKSKANRPTQTFQDAMIEFESIMKSTEQDLALEMFQASLVYVEVSGDAKLIARAKKDVADWSEING